MTVPGDPGNPENTDEQNLSPDEAEAIAAEREQVDQEGTSSLEDQVNEALADVEVELAAEEDTEAAAVEAADAPAPEPTVEEQLAERTEDLQRVTAEYANYRRRTERERSATIEAAKASVVTELLPLLDDLDLAAQHGDVEEGPLKAFNDKFRDILRGQKLTVVGEEGDEFDPEIHEAVQDLSSGDDKIVGTVLRKGYRVNDRLIRTAMVIIADREAEA